MRINQRGYQPENSHLFGIKYTFIIIKNSFKITDIIRVSKLNLSYAIEVKI